MDDLVTWLRDQLDDDDRSARAVLGADASSWDPYGYLPGEKRDYLARFDPARVLAEVDAKRRIIDEHQPNGGACRTCCGEAYMEETWNGEEEQITWKRADKPWPCPTFRLQALPYADRAGYRDEWKP